jgi:hypothetical protein
MICVIETKEKCGAAVYIFTKFFSNKDESIIPPPSFPIEKWTVPIPFIFLRFLSGRSDLMQGGVS